jgi:hypothetical protein
VLEPSPPAVLDEPWFADDPAARGEVPSGRQVVSPVTSGDLLWAEVEGVDPAWAAERWLGPYKALESVPAALAVTRSALQLIATNGKIGLRWTLGGFGTPFFGADAQLRIEGAELVVDHGGEARRTPLTSVGDVAAAIGVDLADRTPLEVDPRAARFVGDWFGFTTSVLEQLRAEARPEWEPSRVQIWPEHFDAAIEIGNEQAEQRAALGGSPGDESHPEPYLYVAPWTARPVGELWQADGFPGAELPYAELLAAPDPRAAALEFFRVRIAALSAA